ncbi:TIGR02677 family protein [Enterocloster citroniae]|uniref:TIGR02677 family protein n=1 Tax=Enterocloster citroniae TaxID=358743 RepID=UPI001D07B3B2|nr:TIGR02677 family protein [Enterocloster citroniae]MCB7068091.1 TIGR02677 family protein [Enterocloster citroniae]
MKEKPGLTSLGNISELRYVNADNVTRYRAIMRYLYLQYERLNYWLGPEQIYLGVMEWNVLKNYTMEQCQLDLDQLVAWKNLTYRHDGTRARTVEEYLRKKYQYLITPYSIELERFLDNLENVKGYGGSLEPTLLDKIADCISDIYEKQGNYDPKAALEVWNLLYDSFQKLNQTSMDYIASLHTGTAEDLMMTSSFLQYKDSITTYLQDFVQALQRRSYRIEGNLKLISQEIQTQFFTCVLDGEWLIPKVEEFFTREEYRQNLERRWGQLCRWFCGDNQTRSELFLLERASKDAIKKIVRSTLRIQEKQRSIVSRRQDLDFLGKWFYRLEDVNEAHKLAAYAFGIFPTRHLQGEDNRDSDSQDISMWDEITIERFIRSRSRKRNGKGNGESETVADNREKKEALRQQLVERQKQDLVFLIEMTEKGRVKVSELECLSSAARVQLLSWIGRCISSERQEFFTPEGVKVTLFIPVEKNDTILNCEDGTLTLLDYTLKFVIENQDAWQHLLNGVAGDLHGE